MRVRSVVFNSSIITPIIGKVKRFITKIFRLWQVIAFCRCSNGVESFARLEKIYPLSQIFMTNQQGLDIMVGEEKYLNWEV